MSEGYEMKKKYNIYVDCAACAVKIEDALNKLDEVKSARINFMMGKLYLEADEINGDLIDSCQRIGGRVDSDFLIYK